LCKYSRRTCSTPELQLRVCNVRLTIISLRSRPDSNRRPSSRTRPKLIRTLIVVTWTNNLNKISTKMHLAPLPIWPLLNVNFLVKEKGFEPLKKFIDTNKSTSTNVCRLSNDWSYFYPWKINPKSFSLIFISSTSTLLAASREVLTASNTNSSLCIISAFSRLVRALEKCVLCLVAIF